MVLQLTYLTFHLFVWIALNILHCEVVMDVWKESWDMMDLEFLGNSIMVVASIIYHLRVFTVAI